ncbi:DsbA family oxidoreductase [Paracoccus sp. M683]|uniref:DsbA family oxidoreductase n=1 Tax=Paracoccus sp. M683 TaxID=2594268 RepID=UPI001181400A|nr:DsbA family oxidoreductase [Paracoccus sp. M683]TRW99154.1 DsbA family oxidoreductase [Paracoccus sp. M683]
MTAPFKIDIWSDIACPWCYIGKRRLEAALDRFDGAPVQITWHGFELNPDAPAEYPGTQADYLAKHLGASPQQVQQMSAQVTSLAAREGLDYDLDAVQITNTGKAHELIHFAQTQGKGAEMKERLLKAYFTDGRHVGRIDDLADLAAEIGLDRAAARQALESGDFAKDVADDKAQARAFGIQGVPFFVMGGKYGLSGAQEADTFLQALNKVQSEQTETSE